MKLLHIVATPRPETSNTLRISNAFLAELKAKHRDLKVDTLELFSSDLPSVAGDNIDAKYRMISGLRIDQQHEESWRQIEDFIKQFLEADLLLLSSPMWNFGIPYALKYFIDAVVQPGYLFRHNEQGMVEGLVTDKKMVCITSRGGNYAPGTPFHAYDFLEPYLRAIFGFVGITDMRFINAHVMDHSYELREENINRAIEEARLLSASMDWRPDQGSSPRTHPGGLKPRASE